MAGGSGRHLGSDLGCGSQRRSFFDSGMGLYGGGLLDGGCDVCHRPMLMASSAGRGAACQQRPLW
jgi:hypothetical protein